MDKEKNNDYLEKVTLLCKSLFQDHCDRKNRILFIKKYADLLVSWGVVHNLFSRNLSVNNVWENIYDSVISYNEIELIFNNKKKYLNSVVDAGAGNGFPGILLSILFPEFNFTLVDSNRKKCSFLRLVKSELNLQNISIVNKRIEDIEKSELIITKAAFSPKNVGILAETLNKGGQCLIWATPNTADEFVHELDNFNLVLVTRYDYQLSPDNQRSLLLFEKE